MDKPYEIVNDGTSLTGFFRLHPSGDHSHSMVAGGLEVMS